jgi:phosphate:Na+ symporter
MIGSLLGGIGLFLLGMSLLTSGLQAVAGDRLRAWLRASTRSHTTGLLAGTAATALIQSSSAVTLAAVGFVGAGLLTFSQSIGILYGANLGTTSTAWIVSMLGLKIKIDAFALPIVGIGAGLKVFGGRRLGQAGYAVAGFGLIFVGIDVLQQGMAGVAERMDPSSWASPGIGGTVLLVLGGALMTVVMQSSSAAIATTLAAVHAGSLGLEHAALLAIGQNVGTTAKAALLALGTSIPARRAAIAHVLFNVSTGILALLTLPAFLVLVRWVSAWVGGDDPAVQLAIFHSLFNLVGVAVFLPWTDRFASFIEYIVPDRVRGLTRRFVDPGAAVPEVRLEAAGKTIGEILRTVLDGLEAVLSPGPRQVDVAPRLEEAEVALASTRAWLAPLRTDPTTPVAWHRHVALLHSIDHLDRLVATVEQVEPAARFRREEALSELGDVLIAAIAMSRATIESRGATSGAPEVEALAQQVADYRRIHRPKILEETARSALSPLQADVRLEAIRWAEQVAFHLWRAVYHLNAAQQEDAGASESVHADPPPDT